MEFIQNKGIGTKMFKEKTAKDNPAILEIVPNLGSVVMVTRGKIHKVEDLDGILVYKDEKIIGLGLYRIENDCEIVLLETFMQNQGIGTQIIEKIKEKAIAQKCERIWLITTNENINALRFYQKRGFYFSNLYKNAIEESRRIIPEIPKMEDGIEIRDEIEFEMLI